jgi:hypothetical protein
MQSKNGGDGGTHVYMREGTTSRVMAADRSYGEFYEFYSISPEYFRYTLVKNAAFRHRINKKKHYCCCTNFIF